MILVLLGCLLIGGTNGARYKRLVGAFDIDITKVPYQVSIRMDDYHICGGTLITKRHVLTAAHCVFDLFEEPYDELTIVTGTDRLKSGGTSHNVQNIKWHDEYEHGAESLWHNDIAIITLASNVTENERQKPILLPIKDVPLNVTGLVTGFGRTVTENPYLSPTLKGIDSRILSNELCERFAISDKIPETQICGMHPRGIGLCKGDSGGPFAYEGRIIGISSWNQPNPCGSGIPDVFTNVYRYLDFIRQVIDTN